MKKLFLVMTFCLFCFGMNAQDLIITGAFDGPLSGGTPKGVELYVVNNIADLSMYGLGSANNGGGTDGEEFTFPAVSAMAGDFIYVASEAPNFTAYFGFAPDYTSGAMSINGDDAIELFFGGAVIDVFGDINTDGTGEPWDHVDGWAYRVDATGPDGSTFVLANWTFSGPDALDGSTTNAGFPIGSYSAMPVVGGTCDGLVLSGLVDGPLSGGSPKVIEIYVANDVSDLSQYGFGIANNGGGTDGQEFTFPADMVTAGDYIYITDDAAAFSSYFGFAADYVSGSVSMNGDDAVELFCNDNVIDTFGDINTDGTGEAWDYLDCWVSRTDVTSGPDGSTFEAGEWTYGGVDCLDGTTSNDPDAGGFPSGESVDPTSCESSCGTFPFTND